MALWGNSKPDNEVRSQGGRGETFTEIFKRNISRRTLFKGVAAASTVALVNSTPISRLVVQAAPEAQEATFPLGFIPIQPSQSKTTDVAPGHRVQVLLKWGDPILPGAPEWDPANLNKDAQLQQFGYNCDMVAYFPLPDWESGDSQKGILCVNHEYTNQNVMFPGYDADMVTQEQVDVEMAAHGVSVVEIEWDAETQAWTYNQDSSYNRRLSLFSEFILDGPVAGSDIVKTAADPDGTTVLGTVNNCAGGHTPWGTYLTAEENIQSYFGMLDELSTEDVPSDVPALHERYGFASAEPTFYRWLRYYDQFDISKNPNEPFRFGYLVEIDPYDPEWMPRKRSALGRFRHEAGTTVLSTDNKVVVYTGDDARFEYMYKFVSDESYDPEMSREAARDSDLLNSGTLYVAKFNDDLTGEWMPLIHGQNGLEGTVVVNGDEYTFDSQADVLAKTRIAADFLGATKMDRPEDIEPNPVNGKVYVALTNNTQREAGGEDIANPRGPNPYGHILELTEGGDEENPDHAATTFSWNIFMLCGSPEDADTLFGDFAKPNLNAAFSGIAAPDNITFDNEGNLWIATDGIGSLLDVNDGLFAVPVEGVQRGHIGQFFSGVLDCEVCGPEFTPDDTTLFLAIQHPGDEGDFNNPSNRWPDFEEGTPPRPSVLAIQVLEDDGTIGQAKIGRYRPQR